MSQVHPELQSDNNHQPSGLFAKALKTNNKTIWLFLLINFTVTVLHTIQAFNIHGRFESLWHIYYATSYLAICVSLIFNRKSYDEFISYFEREIGAYMSNDYIRKYIAKNRTLITIGYPYILTIYIIYGAYNTIVIYQQSQSYYRLIIQVFWNLFRTIIYLNHYVIIQFITECCLHAQVCFKIVEDQVESLKMSDSSLNFEEMQKIRQLYDVAIGKTRKLDSLLFWVLPVYYFTCIGTFQLNLIFIIYEYKPINLMLMVREVFALILLTFHIANINRLANEAFNQVYSLSYKVESIEMQNEMRFFFTRIRRGNVGLTILKIVLITPAFVTSFGTLLLTIALSIPTISREIEFKA
uniref:Gustatory receptor n=1 Tax=Tetranychus urticae TaxID=32264 RepID=T1KTH9_TETUR